MKLFRTFISYLEAPLSQALTLKSHIVVILVLLCLPHNITAQEGELELKQKAEALFNEEKYEEAFPLYSQLLSLKVQDAEYNYRFGACQLFTGQDKEEALKYLQFAVDNDKPPPLALFYYGLGLHLNYRFDKAIDQYQKYQAVASKRDRESALVAHYIQQCVSGKNLVSSFTDISVIHREVLPRSEFFRNYDLSELGGKIIVKPDDFMSEEDKKRNARFLMYFQQDADYIYYASYSSKNATGKDLYVIQKLPTGGWSNPQRLSEVINTSHDEDYPFIHPQGDVLYFASKGHNSMGGFDIFKSVRKGDGSWTQPENMEFAINTPWDDFMFITDTDEKSAWFSSNRTTDSKNVTVYKIGIERVPLDLTIIQGTFEAEGSRRAKITVEDVVQNKVIGIYESKRQLGEYLIDLRGSGKYKFIVEAEESSAIHTGIVEVPRDKGLKQFRQEMKLATVDGREQLQIINHFDEPLEGGESLLTADILKRQASLDVNASERDLEILDEGTPAADAGLSKMQKLEAAKNKVATLKNSAGLMNQKAASLYERAQAKSTSSNPADLAEAAIAAELAGIYKEEAEKREAALERMEGQLATLESPELQENAFNAQYNQLSATAGNFEPVEKFEAAVEKEMEQRIDPSVANYEAKKNEVSKLESHLAGIDEEVAYYRAEMESTKDDLLKEELNTQIQEAEKDRPVKEAALQRARSEMEAAEKQKSSAEAYLGLAGGMLSAAPQNVSPAVTASAINEVQSQLREKVGSDPALIPLIEPEKATGEAVAENNPETAGNGEAGKPGTGTQAGETTETIETTATSETTGTTGTNLNTAGETEAEVTSAEGNTTGQDGNPATRQQGTVNEEIRQIESTPSPPQIIPGNYDTWFRDKITQAGNAEDPVIAESRKAELYDQWVENIQYRIDSLQPLQDAETDTQKKLAIADRIASLKEEKEEKEALTMASYQAIAELSDQQAIRSEQAASNPVTVPPVTPELLAGEGVPPAVEKVNATYESRVTQSQAIADPLARDRALAAAHREWADALARELDVLNAQINSTDNSGDKDILTKKAALVKPLLEEKQNRATELDGAVALAESEKRAATAQSDLQQQLYEYVENYDSQAFRQLQGQVDIIPDEEQRLMQTRTLHRNWMIALHNEEIKTEARLNNSPSPLQKADLEEKMAALAIEKQEVQLRLDSIDAGEDGAVSAVPQNVIVRGSERYEGYQPVATEKPAEYEAKAATIGAAATQKQDEVTQLESTLATTKKKKERAALEEEIAGKGGELAVLELESSFYQNAAPMLESVEPRLLQMEKGDSLPSTIQHAVADKLQEEARTQTSAANTMRVELENIKKKKEREAALAEVRVAEQKALVKRREADMAQALASEMEQIESQAIVRNFIVIPGTEVQLPVVTRTLNPAEQKDVASTQEFVGYDTDRSKADSIRAEAQKLQAREIQLKTEAQALMAQSAGAGREQLNAVVTDRVALADQAYEKFDEADSLSVLAARLTRQAAYMENEANRRLLTNPEEVYMNILAYYNSTPAEETPEPAATETAAEEVAETGQQPPVTPVTATEPDSEIPGTTGQPQSGNSETEASTTPEQPFNLLPPEEQNQPVQVKPDVLTNTIFEVDRSATRSNYSSSNPIPVNVKLPDGIIYKVQIGAFRNAVSPDAFKGIKPIVGESAGNGLTRYSAGQFTDFPSADFAKDEIREIGYRDAFVVAYQNGKRIPVSQARAIQAGSAVAATSGNNTESVPARGASSSQPATPARSTGRGIVKQGPLKIEAVENHSGVFFTVQVGVYSKPVSASQVYNISPLNQENMPNGLYRYSSGIYTSEAAATTARDEIRAIGISDAFVTAYRNGKRITMEEARTALGGGVPRPGAEPRTPPAQQPVQAPVQAPNPTPEQPPVQPPADTGKYRISLGTFSGDIPVSQAAVILRLSAKGVEKVSNGDGSSTYYYGSFTSREEAEAEALRLQKDGLIHAKAESF